MKENRFTVKFNNGYWKVFDTVNFTDVAVCDLYTQAIFNCTQFNTKKG